MHVAIIGGGNGGHAMAAEFGIAGHHVTLCTSDETKRAGLVAMGGVAVHGVLGERVVPLHGVTGDVESAINGSEIVVLPVPGMVQERFLDRALPLLRGQPLWLAPGTGGSLIAARRLRDQGRPESLVFETATLPYGSRMTSNGTVGINALLNLQVSTFPATRRHETREILEKLFQHTRDVTTAIIDLPHALASIASSVNPMIHPVPSLMNYGVIEGRDGYFSIYAEGMSPGVLQVMNTVDLERQAIQSALGVQPVALDQLYEELGTGPIYRQSMNLGVADRFLERFIVEDVPIGLVTLSSIGRRFGVPTPTTDAIVNLANAVYKTDFWNTGRTLTELGLGELDPETILRYLEFGLDSETCA